MAALIFFSNKGLKNARCNVRNSLKFSKISRKDLLCTKMQKNGYREFDHSGTLNPNKKKERKFNMRTLGIEPGWHG